MEDGLKVGKGSGLGSVRRQGGKGSRHWASDEAGVESIHKETMTGRLVNKIGRLQVGCVVDELMVGKHEALDWTPMRTVL